VAFPDDDELETPKPDVGAQSEVDIAFSRRGHDRRAEVG
jgi:hypothetical protein